MARMAIAGPVGTIRIRPVIEARRSLHQRRTTDTYEIMKVPVHRSPAQLRREGRCRAQATPRRPRGRPRSGAARNADESRRPG